MSATEGSGRALFLPEACDFTLLHCGRPMRCNRSRSTWEGKHPDGASHTTADFTCDRCEATLEIQLREPDRPDPDTTT